MSLQLLKLFGSGVLALLLVSSGIAWALQSCALRSHAADHQHAPYDWVMTVGAAERDHRPPPLIHCPEYHRFNVAFAPPSPYFRLQLSQDEFVLGTSSQAEGSNASLSVRANQARAGPGLSYQQFFLPLRI